MHVTRFNWKQCPTKILRDKLWVAGLTLDVFKENPKLFD